MELERGWVGIDAFSCTKHRDTALRCRRITTSKHRERMEKTPKSLHQSSRLPLRLPRRLLYPVPSCCSSLQRFTHNAGYCLTSVLFFLHQTVIIFLYLFEDHFKKKIIWKTKAAWDKGDLTSDEVASGITFCLISQVSTYYSFRLFGWQPRDLPVSFRTFRATLQNGFYGFILKSRS